MMSIRQIRTEMIPNGVLRAMDVLERSGYEAYIVGGCVRDFLMGRIPHDFDVTTNAKPEEMKACFKGYRLIETGIRHGTLTVVIDGENIEITTYRIDGEYTDNRHPSSVTFTSALEDDLARRDFTVNAMAFSPKRGLVDSFGGIADLEARMIRCVGIADERFNEDGLRIIRALRFSSVLDFDIERDTAASAHSNATLLHGISVERIYSEFTKLLLGKRAPQLLRQFRDVIEIFLPDLARADDVEYVTAATAVGLCEESAAQRYAALLGFSFDTSMMTSHANEISRGLSCLKSDTKTKREAIAAYSALTGLETSGNLSARRAIRHYGMPTLDNAIALCRACLGALGDVGGISRLDRFTDAVRAEYAGADACFSLSQLAINGADVIALGVSGSAVGRALECLLDEVVDQKLPNDRELLLARAKEMISGE